MWTVYMLRCSDGSFYTGITNDLEKRLKRHQSGRGAKYTRCRRPVEVVHTEPAADRRSAMRREIAIKRMTRAAKMRLIQLPSSTG